MYPRSTIWWNSSVARGKCQLPFERQGSQLHPMMSSCAGNLWISSKVEGMRFSARCFMGKWGDPICMFKIHNIYRDKYIQNISKYITNYFWTHERSPWFRPILFWQGGIGFGPSYNSTRSSRLCAWLQLLDADLQRVQPQRQLVRPRGCWKTMGEKRQHYGEQAH